MDELRAAELKVLLVTQHESFPDEHRKLREQHPVSRKSPISRLSPFIGPGGLLRATGRIKRLADAEFDMKHPIILDGRHPVVKLLLIDSHSKFHHEGVEFLRAQLQQRFSILKLRAVLRSIKHHCVVCRKRDATPHQPMMADLPVERLSF